MSCPEPHPNSSIQRGVALSPERLISARVFWICLFITLTVAP